MYPLKLKNDAIIEALCEARFECDEMPEIIIGRLSDSKYWQEFTIHRLPISDIPTPIRIADENLKFQPVVELRHRDGTHVVKIGGNVISYHILNKYCGWEKLQPELDKMIRVLYEKIEKTKIIRLGFRYINALLPSKHFIDRINSLNINIDIAGTELQENYNLNYLKKYSETHGAMIKIVSPMFVKGNLPVETSAVIDIDVYTQAGYLETKIDNVLTWITLAHDYEKDAFFNLIPKKILEKLKEDKP